MAGADNVIEIRSFRVCFRLERRIHKIDRWRLPVPYGVPLRGAGYAAVALLTMLIVDRLPVFGALVGLINPWLRFLVIPIGIAYVLLRWKVDGRAPHAAGVAWLRMQLRPRRIAAFRAAPRSGPVRLGSVTIAPDASGARYRKGVVEGPANVLLRYPAALRPRGRTLHVRPEEGGPLWRGKEVTVRAGQRVVIG
jgi:hypothetical protein